MSNQQETIFRTLWLLLHDEPFLKANAAVKPEVFPRGALRYLAGLSTNYYRQHQGLLTKSLVALATDGQSAALRRMGATADQARQVYEDLSMEYLVEDDALTGTRAMCREWLERRQIQASIEKAADSITSGDLVQARAHLASAELPQGDKQEVVHLNATSPDFMATSRVALPGAIPTGFDQLDALWEGGYRPGDIGMVVGSTGVGKSMALAFYAAEAFWCGTNIMYYTFELTPAQIRDRISLAILKKGKLDVHDSWDVELTRAYKRRGLSKVPNSDIDIRGGSQSWAGLTSDLDTYQRQWGKYPEVLLLDSADDLAPITKREKTYEQLKDAYTYMRALAYEKQIRIWTSGQLNREAVERARVSLRNIGDSFAKAQRSHYVLGFAQTEENKLHDDGPQMQLYVLKDSLHGTAGAHLSLATMFGRGKNGYAGYEITQTSGMPVD